MWQWLSGLDINAVFLAVVAALGYLHNHNFRSAQSKSDKAPS